MASLYNSDSDDDVLEAAVVAMLVDFNHGKADRSCWVRPWIARRSDLGAYNALMRELEAEDTKSFVNFLRMDRESFDQLLDRVSPMITKADTPMRDSIPPGEKLAITLRYLATGRTMNNNNFMNYSYCITQMTFVCVDQLFCVYQYAWRSINKLTTPDCTNTKCFSAQPLSITL